METGYSSQERAAQRQSALARLCETFQVEILYAFGSRADQARAWMEGTLLSFPSDRSDLDIGVKPAWGQRLSVQDKARLAIALEDLFQVGRVDLVSMEEADPFLAANIVRGERLYARDEVEADEYDLYSLRRAGDLVPLERERIALILGGSP